MAAISSVSVCVVAAIVSRIVSVFCRRKSSAPCALRQQRV